MAKSNDSGQKQLTTEIVSTEGILYQDTVDEILLPTLTGQIGILPNHIALFTKLVEGEIIIIKGQKEQIFAIIGGFVEVNDNTVTILTDYAIKAESIEIAKVQEAKRRAEKIMEEKGETQDFVMAEKELQRSLLSLKVAEKVKRRQKTQ